MPDESSAKGTERADPSQTGERSATEPAGEDAKENSNNVSGGRKRGTSVSFKDHLDEIDLETGQRAKTPPRPSALKSARFYVVLLGLLTPFVVTYSKCIINFAITDMIDPEFAAQSKSANGKSVEVSVAQNPLTNPSAYFDIDNSCPVDEVDRARLLADNERDIKRAHEGTGEKFKWDTVQQGLLKAAYTFGHAPLSVVGGRLSEIYGSHWILSINTVLIGLACLLAPYLAQLHFYLLFADLVLLGVLGSFMSPALITLFANWLTPGEKSMTLSILFTASRLGFVLSSLLCGILIEAQLSWRYVFFSAGWIGFTFGALIFMLVRSQPQDHPLVSQVELDYLASKNALVREAIARREEENAAAKVEAVELKVVRGDEDGKKKQEKPTNSAPWAAIATNRAVWAFVVTKFCLKLAADTVQIELPVYLNRVMHFSAKDNGVLNAWNYVMFCCGCLFVGFLSKVIVKKRPFGLSKTAIRKTFQCISSLSVSLLLLGLATSICDNTLTRVWLLILFFMTTFSTAGEAQIPLDITQRYSGTIHAIGSSLAVSGAIEPTFVGFLLKGHAADKDSWKAVWIGASMIAFLGGLTFLFFGDASVQDFDSIGRDETAKESGEEKIEGNDNNAFVKDQVETKAEQDQHRESKQI